ncbi:MAG TPA: NAD(P)-dependent oxidoreductase [Rubrivivax sp.]|nr:NAD(P)-dependent oxidoreductase [Rubrivivax sp.]
MDVLIVEALDPDVLNWLTARHAVRYAPELAQQPHAFRDALHGVRSIIIPPSVALDAAALQRAPRLRIVGRLSAGAENIDIEACGRAGIEVVRPASASAAAEAEFVIGALLQMLRRVPIISDDGLLVGRELGGLTVGLVGMTATVKPLKQLLQAFGARIVGYDPGMHASDPIWARSGIEPVGLLDLLRASDAVAVVLTYFPRFAGLFGERLLSECRFNQVWVSLAHSSLFDEHALAQALREGPLAAAWLDSLEPGALDPGRPLRHIDTLQVTPRVGATTRQSRVRSAWAVARRIDELLLSSPPPPRQDFSQTQPGAFADLEDGPTPA